MAVISPGMTSGRTTATVPVPASPASGGVPRHALAPPRTWRSAVLAAAAAGFAAAFALAYVLFVRTASGQQAEDGVVHSAQSAGRSTVDWAQPLRQVDLVVVLGGTGLVVLLLALVRRRFALGVTALVLLLAPLAAAQLLKLYVLVRPDVTDGSGAPGHNSFPSGHVSAAAAVLFALAVVLPARLRTWVLAAGVPCVAWVAAATVALGWHRLSDTVGGALLVAAVVCTGAAVVSARRPDGRRIPPVTTAIALAGPSAVVLGGFVVLSSATSGAARFVAALTLAALGVAAVVLLAAGPLRPVNFDPSGVRTRVAGPVVDQRTQRPNRPPR
ncbi:phosphatase PAP2 family protein [Amycolatopsis jiangsuensis]|uniref:Membrane-associated phospholipid phosphatase n=1 Tax=Amycolatopsis jiangsuensis TaxID=1181879 RepID=A0A840IN93_9PSEU|nr:phosphatase PAP2 family protein [Amycolatopsis jiangsuensis]MBB4682847.1 membrane-associated phospholipid phosphatase [Amycolatopsis jiangsuensis]